jgi:hypothetical protein
MSLSFFTARFDSSSSSKLTTVEKFEILFLCRGVAQLVAHSLWERGVVSSSLATPTIIDDPNNLLSNQMAFVRPRAGFHLLFLSSKVRA